MAETQHFEDLRQLLPDGIEYVVLADRAYGHSRVSRQLERIGFKFVIRCKAGTMVQRSGGWHPMDRISFRSAVIQDFGFLNFSKSEPTRLRVVRTWDRAHKESLHMITNLDAPACTIIKLYSHRFRIEGFFRDAKDPRYGFQLGAKFIEDFDVLEGLLVLFTCAYLVFELAGLHAIKRGWHRDYADAAGRRVARWRLGRELLQDDKRNHLVTAKHLLTQLPNLALKVEHWDWKCRPLEVLRLRIDGYLKAKHVRTGEFAKAVNRKPTIVCSILRGRKRVPLCLVQPIARFLGLTKEQLLEGTGWTPATDSPGRRRTK
jgi:hypothetical protein